MNINWSTKEKDMSIAQQVMEQYAIENNSSSLELFELVVNTRDKCMNFRMAAWVVRLALHFKELYGDEHGDFVTRHVISHYIKRGHTLH